MEAPPSYASVIAAIEKKLGPNPTAEEMLAVAESVPETHIDVILANTDKLPEYNNDDAQKVALNVELAKAASTPEATECFKVAAEDAVKAAKEIEGMFQRLTVDLAEIDQGGKLPEEGPFVPRLKVVHDKYRTILNKSTDLAVIIATYGLRFETIIIPICNDPSLSVDKKKAKLDEFIIDATRFSESSKATEEEFKLLKADFVAFVELFVNWATVREAEQEKRLENAKLELANLKADLKNLEDAVTGLTIFATVGLPVIGLFGLCLGPLGMAIMLGVIGVSFLLSWTSIFVLGFIIKNKHNKIQDKQKEIANIESSIQKLRSIREQLTKAETGDLAAFNRNINVLSAVWSTAHKDALTIREWLENGAKDADMPEYLNIAANEAVSVYKSMAFYLRQYADGVTSSSVTSS
ncbi:hypothetical protein NLJ89_g6615 [Agrocybe chaxingu]|uniref:Uncharacterized protein n=1 Tax=Agrocybe chaxingu TaxID=84603 RepID=A0A9W8K634_9AGAR|nr:hypothetical protein NLJ89_g6615 [Agrocybe chaxingu]